MGENVALLARPTREPTSVVLIGSYPPRRCGIATFTRDVFESLTTARPNLACEVFAMTDEGGPYLYPDEVSFEIAQNRAVDYRLAAARLRATRPDVIFVQHEFGIFGGSAGEQLMLLLNATDRPVVSVLHTVLDEPNDDQRRVLNELIQRSHRLVVMAERGRAILRETWKVADEKIVVIPHGAPDRPLCPTQDFKAQLGWGDKELLFSFGLLSPNKGLEYAIRALPAIASARPHVLYAVLGATHPHLVAKEGESYRQSLVDMARDLGVEKHLQLIDEYVDTPRLIDYLRAADVYISPYLNGQQITSGTLSYAAALGAPIVSTGYWHAQELLADGAGRLVRFADSGAIAREVIDLLSHPDERLALRQKMYARGRGTIWSCFAENALSALSQARPPRTPEVRPAPRLAASLDGVRRMTDACGMTQHSRFGVVDRRHGYCVDDNARALLLMCRLPGTMDAERRQLTHTYAAFVHHAWNPDRGRFRNFMSYERTWLEDTGSHDSNGRTFWAVAEVLAHAADPGLRRWARGLVGEVLPRLPEWTSPRTTAFTLLGLAKLVEAGEGSAEAIELAQAKLATLLRMLTEREAQGEPWFEGLLAYDNARLPEALIRAGAALDDGEAVAAGLRSLTWLCARQTTQDGLFLPVTTADMGLPLEARTMFDQQPVEAWATIDACDAAHLLTQDPRWAQEAERAYGWYFGANSSGVSMAAPGGECFDGLTWRGPNENMGAESILSLQLAACTRASLVHRLEAAKAATAPLS